MKEKILFVIDSLDIGGAEKSLLSLLNLVDSSLFEVDLLVFRKGGELESQIPSYVNLLPVPSYFRYVNKRQKKSFKNMNLFYYKIKTSLNLRLNNLVVKPIHSEQVVYKSIQDILSPLPKNYDAAIAYSQGMPTYFVANKVNAKRKLAWINTDYVNALYDKEFDYFSYKKMDKIVVVSQYIKETIEQIKSEYSKKVRLLFDIINPDIIYEKANNKDSHFMKSTINILTVGRLESVKGYDKAIEVAKELKKSNYQFKWYVIGEGTEREKLEYLIDENDLSNQFILLGKKINPYPYMKDCDIYVQTSLKEGFGLTVIEAKILNKPIVCTNFPTAKEIINNNVDGLIVEHDIESIYKGIKKYLDNIVFKQKVENKLKNSNPYSTVDQISNFYSLIK